MSDHATLDDLQAPTLDADGPRGRPEPTFALALTIVAHPDLLRVGQRAVLAAHGERVSISRLEPEFALGHGDQRARPLRDRFLSRSALCSIEGDARGVVVRREAPNARIIVDGLPLEARIERDEAELRAGVVLELHDRVALLLHRVDTSAPSWLPSHGIIGSSDATIALRECLARVAATDGTVFLQGETGTGKELSARAIHRASRRSSRPFVAVNVGAIAEGLVASELFGHKRGAFSGAVSDHLGCFLRANGGTLFLDEIGEAPGDVQRSLLRVLETREVQPVGADASFAVDLRVIAATDADLDAAMGEGTFRGSLYYRLAEHVVRVPPLRERPDDIARLMVHFLHEQLDELGVQVGGKVDAPVPWLPASLVGRFIRYPWPGNVRELRNVVREMAVASAGRTPLVMPSRLEPGSAHETWSFRPTVPPLHGDAGLPAPDAEVPPPTAPRALTEDQLRSALRANGYRRSATAKALGISRSSLYSLIKSFPGIREVGHLSEAEIEAAAERFGGDRAQMADALGVSERGLTLRMSELGLT